MQRFLPALLVLILIFGVRPLEFMLILAVVVLGLAFECHTRVSGHETCGWCRTMHWFCQKTTVPQADDRANL